MTDIQLKIVAEISRALESLNADRELEGIIGSWGETYPDEEILAMLRESNRESLNAKPPVLMSTFRGRDARYAAGTRSRNFTHISRYF